MEVGVRGLRELLSPGPGRLRNAARCPARTLGFELQRAGVLADCANDLVRKAFIVLGAHLDGDLDACVHEAAQMQIRPPGDAAEVAVEPARIESNRAVEAAKLCTSAQRHRAPTCLGPASSSSSSSPTPLTVLGGLLDAFDGRTTSVVPVTAAWMPRTVRPR